VVEAEGRLWDVVVTEGKLFVEVVACISIVSELREYPGRLAVHSAIPIRPSDNPTRTFRPIGTTGPEMIRPCHILLPLCFVQRFFVKADMEADKLSFICFIHP
jgi:hypothetical protein